MSTKIDKIITIGNLEHFTEKMKKNNNVQAIEPGTAIDDIATYKYIINTTADNITLTNYDYYRKTNISSNIVINFENNIENNNEIVTNYCLEFTTAEAGTTVSLPNTIKWINGETPEFENGFTYQLSIVNGFGVFAKFK